MRAFLLTLIVLEGLALFVAGGLVLFADQRTAETPDVPVFRPPLYDAVIGDKIRYRRIDRKTNREIGFVDFEVTYAVEFAGTNLGREFRIEVVERDASGRSLRNRRLRWRPRDTSHGFLPPRFNEDELAPGDRPVVARIATAEVELHRKKRHGFVVETVIPARSLTEIAERYWFHRDVAIFGVARWERVDDILILHTQTRAAYED